MVVKRVVHHIYVCVFCVVYVYVSACSVRYMPMCVYVSVCVLCVVYVCVSVCSVWFVSICVCVV